MKSLSTLFTWALGIALLVVVLLVTVRPVTTRYAINDFVKTRNYSLPDKAKVLVEDIALTDDAVHTFRATRPEVRDKSEFNDVCPASSESRVLGCYSADTIYVLEVDDPQLDGVEQVTAAHELLHAEWARLEQTEKDRIGELLQQEYRENIDNTRLVDLIESYESSNEGSDPDLVPNELHSILPTELPTLGEELESYYANYFKDRQKVVAYYKSYESEFQERRERISQITVERDALSKDIDLLNSETEQLVQQNKSLVAEINRLRSEGEIAQSNELVPQQNSVARLIRVKVDLTNTKVSRYNELVAENNSLAVELSDLASGLDATQVDL